MLGLIALLSLALLASSCAPPEQRVIDAYLGAVRDGDEAIMKGVSLASPPEGGIESWEVIEIGTESTEAYRLAEIRAEHFQAKQALEEKVMDNDEFLRENEKIALRYQQKMKEDPDYKYTRGSMAKFQEEWEAKDEERKELQKKVEEAKEALERERNAIRMSTNIPLKESLEGDVAVKKAKVNINSASGSKTYTLTLRKYNMVDSDTGLRPRPGWIVTDIEG
jgi:hypothetical protein